MARPDLDALLNAAVHDHLADLAPATYTPRQGGAAYPVRVDWREDPVIWEEGEGGAVRSVSVTAGARRADLPAGMAFEVDGTLTRAGLVWKISDALPDDTGWVTLHLVRE